MLNYPTNNTCRNRVRNWSILKKKSLFERPPSIRTCVQTYKFIEDIHIPPTTPIPE